LGYYNAFFGKWHLGSEPYYPIHQGFDEQYFVTEAGNPFHYYPPYFRNSEKISNPERYLTDSLTSLACAFINKYDKAQPLEMSVFYYNVHGPHEGRKDLVEMYLEKGYSKEDATYAAMVTSVDESVGKIIAALKKNNRFNNTVILFISDQGGYYANPPYSGSKMERTLYEGGARVPFFIYYPEKFKQQTITTPVTTNDVFPTLIDLAGGNLPRPNKFNESLSLVPLITKQKFPKRIIYSYRAYESLYAGLVDGPWKFLAYRDGRTALFNLDKDIAEENDLGKQYPGKITFFVEKLKAWEVEKNMQKYSPFF